MAKLLNVRPSESKRQRQKCMYERVCVCVSKNKFYNMKCFKNIRLVLLYLVPSYMGSIGRNHDGLVTVKATWHMSTARSAGRDTGLLNYRPDSVSPFRRLDLNARQSTDSPCRSRSTFQTSLQSTATNFASFVLNVPQLCARTFNNSAVQLAHSASRLSAGAEQLFGTNALYCVPDSGYYFGSKTRVIYVLEPLCP